MNRPFTLQPLSGEEQLEVQRLIRAPSTPPELHRRCIVIWELAAGASITGASGVANLHYTNAHKWVKRFQAEGLAGLRNRIRPRSAKIHTGKVEDLVIRIAASPPQDLGLEFTTWSLVRLERHLRQNAGTSAISRESIRQILTRHRL